VSAERISTEEAKQDKLFYVVPNVIPVREDGRCLILKRDEREKVHPGKWATIGGKMEHADFDVTKPDSVDGDVLVFKEPTFKLLVREALEEAGVTIVKPIIEIPDTEKLIIRPDGIPVRLATYAVRYGSGEVVLEEGGFTDFAWVNEEEIAEYDCIEGVPQVVIATTKLFKK
jgi:8-oxo-dGTP pyrophosphatase MutT (NUDIX family)